MPRKSPAALVVPRVDGRPDPLPVPVGLSKPAARVWRAITSAIGPGHFRPSDSPLLRTYCEATALADEAARELARSGAVTIDGRVSPWIAVLEKASRAQTSLALRLRLCPSARIDSRAAGRTPSAPDLAALLGEEP